MSREMINDESYMPERPDNWDRVIELLLESGFERKHSFVESETDREAYVYPASVEDEFTKVIFGKIVTVTLERDQDGDWEYGVKSVGLKFDDKPNLAEFHDYILLLMDERKSPLIGKGPIDILYDDILEILSRCGFDIRMLTTSTPTPYVATGILGGYPSVVEFGPSGNRIIGSVVIGVNHIHTNNSLVGLSQFGSVSLKYLYLFLFDALFHGELPPVSLNDTVGSRELFGGIEYLDQKYTKDGDLPEPNLIPSRCGTKTFTYEDLGNLESIGKIIHQKVELFKEVERSRNSIKKCEDTIPSKKKDIESLHRRIGTIDTKLGTSKNINIFQDVIKLD